VIETLSQIRWLLFHWSTATDTMTHETVYLRLSLFLLSKIALLLVSRSLVLRFVGWTRILRFETTDLLNLQFSQVSFLNLKNLLNYAALFSIFSSQHHNMFICANATRGLAQYRALKSRLHPLVTLVEAYEVLKIGLILPANNKQQLNKLLQKAFLR
jgi:hypothetical protein